MNNIVSLINLTLVTILLTISDMMNKVFYCRRILDRNYDKVKDDKVKDPCLLTGIYRASAHSKCNIDLSLTKRSPCCVS